MDCVTFDQSENAESPFNATRELGEQDDDCRRQYWCQLNECREQLREQVQALYDDWGAQRLEQVVKVPDYDSGHVLLQENANQLVRALAIEAGFDSEISHGNQGSHIGPKLVFRHFMSELEKGFCTELLMDLNQGGWDLF